MGLGHCKEDSSFIYINACSIGITRGVKLLNLGLRSRRFLFLSTACPVLCEIALPLFSVNSW